MAAEEEEGEAAIKLVISLAGSVLWNFLLKSVFEGLTEREFKGKFRPVLRHGVKRPGIRTSVCCKRPQKGSCSHRSSKIKVLATDYPLRLSTGTATTPMPVKRKMSNALRRWIRITHDRFLRLVLRIPTFSSFLSLREKNTITSKHIYFNFLAQSFYLSL